MSMIISNRIAALEESATLRVAALCQQLRSEGVDVIGLSLGEPDFPAPAHVKQAAIDAVNNDVSHYGPTPGFPALRQAIADTLIHRKTYPLPRLRSKKKRLLRHPLTPMQKASVVTVPSAVLTVPLRKR